jgi:hypothetical protein
LRSRTSDGEILRPVETEYGRDSLLTAVGGAGVVAMVTSVEVDAFEGPVKTEVLETEVATEGLPASSVEETVDLDRRLNIAFILSLGNAHRVR